MVMWLTIVFGWHAAAPHLNTSRFEKTKKNHMGGSFPNIDPKILPYYRDNQKYNLFCETLNPK